MPYRRDKSDCFFGWILSARLNSGLRPKLQGGPPLVEPDRLCQVNPVRQREHFPCEVAGLANGRTEFLALAIGRLLLKLVEQETVKDPVVAELKVA
jgi:hypothetical protein